LLSSKSTRPYCNQITELKVTGKAGSFACNAFHEAAITMEKVGVIADEIKAFSVVDSCHVRLRHSETNSISEALAERSGRDFNACMIESDWGRAVDFGKITVSVRSLWVARSH
jgi:hypothetical protein